MEDPQQAEAERAFDEWCHPLNGRRTIIPPADELAAYRGFIAGWKAALDACRQPIPGNPLSP